MSARTAALACTTLGHSWTVKAQGGALVEVCSTCGAKPPVEPIDLTCPACAARPFSPCTAPTDTSRRPVKWFHSARTDAAEDANRG